MLFRNLCAFIISSFLGHSSHGGSELLSQRGSVGAILAKAYPDVKWQPWKFADDLERVPLPPPSLPLLFLPDSFPFDRDFGRTFQNSAPI